MIVATYNQEGTLRRALDSVLSQQIDVAYEIIIGDDCSTDSTPSIAREYADRYPDIIRYIRRPQNLGVCLNYFDCIEQSRGKYIADCAGDDFWTDPHKLSRQLAEMEADPDVAMVVTDWLCCDIDGSNLRRHPQMQEVKSRKVHQPHTLTLPLLRHQKMLHLCTALYRRSIIMQAIAKNRDIFINASYICEDLQIQLAMTEGGKVVELPQITLNYSVAAGSISHGKDAARQYEFASGELLQLLPLLQYFNISRSQIRDRLKNQTQYLASLAWRSKSPSIKARFLKLMRTYQLPATLKTRIYRLLIQLTAKIQP